MRALFLTAVMLLLVVIYASCSSSEVKEEAVPEVVVTPRTSVPAPAKAEKSESPPAKGFTPLLAQLPTTEELRKSGQDFHHTPPQIREGSKILGRVAREMKANPANVPAGIQFYADCAAREQVLFALRVVCLRNWRHWADRSGAPGPSNSDFSAEMLAAEKELPPTP